MIKPLILIKGNDIIISTSIRLSPFAKISAAVVVVVGSIRHDDDVGVNSIHEWKTDPPSPFTPNHTSTPTYSSKYTHKPNDVVACGRIKLSNREGKSHDCDTDSWVLVFFSLQRNGSFYYRCFKSSKNKNVVFILWRWFADVQMLYTPTGRRILDK